MTKKAVPLRLKSCTKCGEEKPLVDFYTKGRRLDSICKICKKKRSRDDYQFKFSARDKADLALLTMKLMDFHWRRQREIIAEIDKLMAKTSPEKST